jgi:hypothetical protein
MKLFVEQVDIEKIRAHWPPGLSFAPAVIKTPKEMNGSKWTVLSAPFKPGEPPDWAYTDHDEYIRVPVFPYMLNPDSSLALAFMLQLGLACAGHIPKQITRFYVATGTPVEIVYDSDTDKTLGLRYWIGFAFMTN